MESSKREVKVETGVRLDDVGVSRHEESSNDNIYKIDNQDHDEESEDDHHDDDHDGYLGLDWLESQNHEKDLNHNQVFSHNYDSVNDSMCLQSPAPPPMPSHIASVVVSSVLTRHQLSQKELRLHIVQAIERNDLTIVQQLMGKGLDVNCIILFNKTPLTYAVELQEFHIAQLLVKAGANINAREPLANSRQPLHVAVEKPDLDLIGFLLDHGAEINGKDGCGATAAMVASYHGYLEVVRLLFSRGASINDTDFVGRTALHRAAEGQHEQVVRYLVAIGANINARDKFGWTPLYHSVVFGHTGMIMVLLECGISVGTVDCNNRSCLTVACNRLCPPNVRIVLSTSLDYHKRERKIPTAALHSVLNNEDCPCCEFVIVDMLINAGAQLGIAKLTEFLKLCPNLALRHKQILLHYLLLCGCIGQQEDCIQIASSVTYLPHLHQWLQQQWSLQMQCRVAIRQHLSTLPGGPKNLHASILELPLPLAIRNFLNIAEFAELYPSFLFNCSVRPLTHMCTV